jgi:hypothetical protein
MSIVIRERSIECSYSPSHTSCSMVSNICWWTWHKNNCVVHVHANMGYQTQSKIMACRVF